MFFFLWIFSCFFQKDALRILCKNPFIYSKSTLKQDSLIGFYTWFLGAPVTLVIGQTFDFLICKIFGPISYEQAAVHLLKQAFSSPLLLISTLISILIFAPIIEEFLFRGILQNFLKKYMPRTQALTLSAFFFALIHLSASQGLGNISLFFSLFTFGCFLGFVYEKQGSILASITLHLTFNVITTFQILLM